MLKVYIQRKGDGFTVAIDNGGGGAWGLGVVFRMWAGARMVAVSIVNAAGEGEIVDQTEDGAAEAPKLGESYRAGDLPPGSVVRSTTATEYVVSRTGTLMRWEQPIPGSDEWTVTYTGRLGLGERMTPRERAEVDEARAKTARAS